MTDDHPEQDETNRPLGRPRRRPDESHDLRHSSPVVEALPTAGDRLVPRRVIATGGMGTIELTDDRALLRQVVRKLLNESVRGQELAEHGLVREAQIIAQLNHPNIVPVHELRRDEILGPWFTMQLVEGDTYTELVDRYHAGGRDEDEFLSLLDVIVKVCDAVGFAHSRGVWHCDIKPDNVMVGDFGQVYLMDWGVARVRPGGALATSATAKGSDLGSFTAATSGMATGTLRYAPPEQARGETDRIDGRTDVYSLGAMLYCLLAGKPPHAGGDPRELFEAAAACDPEVLRSGLASATAPQALKEVALRAMSADPAQRFQRAEDLKAELLRFVRGGGSFPRKRFTRGQHVVREGERAETAYLVVSGVCGVYTLVSERTEDLRRLGPGELFGEMGILLGGKRTASVLVVEDCELICITREALEGELDAMKPWIRALVRSLAGRFIDSEQRWLETRRALSAEALAHQVLLHAKSWGTHEPDGALRVPRSLVTRSLESLAEFPTDVRDFLSAYPEIAVEEKSFLVRDPKGLAARLRPSGGA